MSDLKNKLIKMGAANPSLRSHLRPILAELEKESNTGKEEGKRLIEQFAQELRKVMHYRGPMRPVENNNALRHKLHIGGQGPSPLTSTAHSKIRRLVKGLGGEMHVMDNSGPSTPRGEWYWEIEIWSPRWDALAKQTTPGPSADGDFDFNTMLERVAREMSTALRKAGLDDIVIDRGGWSQRPEPDSHGVVVVEHTPLYVPALAGGLVSAFNFIKVRNGDGVYEGWLGEADEDDPMLGDQVVEGGRLNVSAVRASIKYYTDRL